MQSWTSRGAADVLEILTIYGGGSSPALSPQIISSLIAFTFEPHHSGAFRASFSALINSRGVVHLLASSSIVRTLIAYELGESEGITGTGDALLGHWSL